MGRRPRAVFWKGHFPAIQWKLNHTFPVCSQCRTLHMPHSDHTIQVITFPIWCAFPSELFPFLFYSIRIDQVPPDMKSMHTSSLLSLPQISFVPVSSSGPSSWQEPGLMLRKVVISNNSFSHCWMLRRSYLLSRSLAALMGCQGLRFCNVCKQVWAFVVFAL